MLGVFKREKDPAGALKKKLKNYTLPAFPAAVLHALKVIRDPDSDMDEVSEALQADPGTVVKMLSTVNSAAFGLAQRVENVRHAANLMGRSRVEATVLALATRGVLPSEEAPGFDSGRFWQAAARRASLARPLAQRLHPATQLESFTAALLQDMAVPVLAHSLPRQYGPLLDEWHHSGAVALTELESSALGWDHPHIGTLLARTWGLPDRLVVSISGHHGTDEEDLCEPAVRLVAHIRESEDEPGVEKLVEEARSTYGLDPDEVTDLIDEAWKQADELARLLQ